ncbi:MAG: hypothetical protein ACYC69_04025 [Thermodesulfovibrionales bacterium]
MMNILHIVKEELDMTTGAIIFEHEKIAQVTVIDLRENRDYEFIINMMESHDRVICW